MVRDKPSDPSKVFFAAWVRIEDDDGVEKIYRIVGPDEFDLSRGFISMDAPMALALMKKGLDDEVKVQTPDGAHYYYISEVSYSLIE